jgi:hypothetical protein
MNGDVFSISRHRFHGSIEGKAVAAIPIPNKIICTTISTQSSDVLDVARLIHRTKEICRPTFERTRMGRSSALDTWQGNFDWTAFLEGTDMNAK